MPFLKKQTVQELNKSELIKARNRILAFSCLLITPLYLAILFYTESKSNNQALEPIIKQLSQSISIGDGISLDRINKSILLLPRVKTSKVILNDGYCSVAIASKQDQWNNQIKDPCESADTNGFFQLSKPILNTQDKNIGSIRVTYSAPWEYILFFPIIVLVSLLLVYYLFKTTTQTIFQKLTAAVETFPEMIQRNEDAEFDLIELQNTFIELKRLKKVEIDHFKNTALHSMAAQVSHDIRSPLAALEMITGSLEDLPEDNRLIIRNSVNRIRDIANDLLNFNKNTINPTLVPTTVKLPPDEEPSLNLLSTVLDSITTEKRIQYRNLMNVAIEFNQSIDNYGLFANFRNNEFKRVFSNLINNSVESLDNESGSVQIKLAASPTDSSLIEIKIKDTGRGIPAKLIPELGQEGKSFGKPDGNGLGLYYAYKTIKKAGGSISIQSEIGKGTEITITLPRQKAPSWFVPELKTSSVSNIIVFDDDASVHQIWKNRLESKYNKTINFYHFSNPSDLKQFYRKNFSELDETTFLMDYEISNNSETGLDLIEQLGIADSSILVTSRYEEKQIRDRCNRLNVKLIPKTMSGFVPITVN